MGIVGDDEILLDERMKANYILERFHLDLERGRHEFNIACEYCGRKIIYKATISKAGKPYATSIVDGMFHHLDGDSDNNSPDNLLLVCSRCRKIFQYWGIVQRYLKETEKKIEDLPDCTGVPSTISKYF